MVRSHVLKNRRSWFRWALPSHDTNKTLITVEEAFLPPSSTNITTARAEHNTARDVMTLMPFRGRQKKRGIMGWGTAHCFLITLCNLLLVLPWRLSALRTLQRFTSVEAPSLPIALCSPSDERRWLTLFHQRKWTESAPLSLCSLSLHWGEGCASLLDPSSWVSGTA